MVRTPVWGAARSAAMKADRAADPRSRAAGTAALQRLAPRLGWMGVALLVAGCAAAKPAPPAACGNEPAAVLGCVRAREDAVRSLRARFAATTHREAESHRSLGVLLVSKPQRFRLRLMLPLGLTILDYVREGERISVALPLQEEGDAAPSFADLDLAEAFLRGPFAFPGACTAVAADGGEVAVECRAADGALLRSFRLDAASATIVAETSWRDGEPRLELRYADYRPTAGTLLPWRISLAYPDRAVTLAIEIERYEVNPALPAELFQPPT